MLKQLDRLNLEADGRYATDQELQFLKNYLQSVEKRMSAYEKIRDAEEQIIEQAKVQVESKHPNIFKTNSRDFSSIWRRDVESILRYSAATMLIDDLDRLRENLLLWFRTIMHANKMLHFSQVTHEALPEAIKQFLSPEEAELMMPVLQLNQSILS